MKKVLDLLERVGWQSLNGKISIENLSGSSVASTVRISLVVKSGPIKVIENEYRVYQRFIERFSMDGFLKIFPSIFFRSFPKDDVAIMVMESLVGISLEQVILEMGELAKRFGCESREIERYQERIGAMVEKVLLILDILHEPIHENIIKDCNYELRCFVKEIQDALVENLRRANWNSSLSSKNFQQATWVKGEISLAHRDLSVVNIIGNENGVRLIDPRSAVPNGSVGSRYVSPVIDLVALDVSLERKELEVRKINQRFVILARQKICDRIRQMVESGRVTKEMALLCETVVRSSYVACKCEYCLAPERSWLYDQMCSTTEDTIRILEGV